MIDDRGQSELVGTILLVATVVISVTVFGGYALAWFTESATSGGPNVSLNVDGNDTVVVITHGGGHSLERSDVTVVLQGDGGDEQFGLESIPVGNGNDQFEPGERATGSHSLTGTYDVLVVHEPSNQVLYRETVQIGTTTGGPSTPGTSTGTEPETSTGTEPETSTGTEPETSTGTEPDTNDPPSASFSHSPTNPVPGQEISFDASGSVDTDGTITTYEWDWTNDGSYDSTSGSGTATHSYPSTGTYTVALRVTDDDGATDTTTAQVTVSEPTVQVRIDDLSRTGTDSAELLASYDVSNTNSGFQRVEVEFANTADGSATKTSQSTSERGSLRYTNFYGTGQPYDVTVQVIYDDGSGEYEAASETIAVTPDGTNPSGNDDLALGTSATLSSSTIEDRTAGNGRPKYRFGYQVSAGDFSQVELWVLPLGTGDYATVTRTSTSGNNVDLEANYGGGSTYKIAILVFDDQGAVVDARIVTDTADGTGP